MSINQDLGELRKDFNGLRRRLSRLCDVSWDGDPKQKDKAAWNTRFKDETSLAAIRLLRGLEAAAQEATTLVDQSTMLYAARLGQEVDSFRVAVEGQVFMWVPSTDKVQQVVSNVFGVPKKGFVTNYLLKNVDAEKYCQALGQLNEARGIFFSALEDIRMLYELRLLPMEERDRIRQALAEAGMPEVAARLSKADEQRVGDPPACIGHSREALAFTVHSLAKAKVGRSTDSFQADLAELGKTRGFLPPEERRVAVSLYSYLSSKWKAGEEPKPGDAEFALKLTYFFIDRLLGTVSPGKARANG